MAAPTIEAALDGRFLSGLKEQRVKAAEYYNSRGLEAPKQLEVMHTFHGHPAHIAAVHHAAGVYTDTQQQLKNPFYQNGMFRG